MGYALAEAANKAGHKVTFISASDLQPPVGVEFVGVDTAAEMFVVVKKCFPKCDCLIMAAAVSDYTPANVRKTKIKKSDKPLTLKLKPTKDILAWAGKNKKKNQFVVGFALEDKNLRATAQKKLTEKNLDMIIANKPEVIGADETAIQTKTPKDRWLKIGEATKATTAKKLIKLLENLPE